MSMENSPTIGQVNTDASAKPPRRGLSREARWAIIGVLMLLFLTLVVFNLIPRGTLERAVNTGTVIGYVVDANSKPIAASVVVVQTDIEVQTDEQGRFELRGVPAGEHLVVVALDVSGVQYRVEVAPGQVVDMGPLRAPDEDKGR